MLKTENLNKRYFRKNGETNFFEAVKPLSITLSSGTLSVLVGRSGSGKTTLLHMLSGLLTPTGGHVYLDDTDLYSLPDHELSLLRNEKIGVIPQGRSAIDTLTIKENILLPSNLYRKTSHSGQAEKWMDALGIAHLADASPAECSGGELRRMAIARVLTTDPEVILADEPTGDLDDENTGIVLDIFRKVADRGKLVFLVTHETDALSIADIAWRMNSGVLTPVE